LKPSTADEDLTTKIKSTCQYYDIKVLYHVIVTSEGYHPFADEILI